LKPSASSGKTLHFTLLGRNYCHLCDEMLAALSPLREEFGFTVDVIDVDRDAALEQRYGMFVPVLMHDEVELCHYHLDTAKVRAYLGNFR
jgi:hypothetical protein